MFKSFWRAKGGATAVVFAVTLIPISLAVGASIDFMRFWSARDKLQTLADAAALAAATSTSNDRAVLLTLATNVLNAHADGEALYDVAVDDLTITENGEVILDTSAEVQSAFMQLVGYDRLDLQVSSTAFRGVPGTIELAMVLDNTWSMSKVDSRGVSRIAALKSSANILLTALSQGNSTNIKVGLVPYADYVNVGTSNRSQSWLNVPADTTTTSPKICTTKTTKEQCTKTQVGSKQTCTKYVDGVAEQYDCTVYTNTCTTITVAPYESCTGGGTTTNRWYGCVGSRTSGTLRLNDTQPATPYPGYLATSANCLNPIVPLTNNFVVLKQAIDGMIINIGSYKPATYIPAGLIWGINILSPTEPFSEGRAYDPANTTPKKVLVVMTDGENTLTFNSTNGRHVAFSSNATTAATQRTATNNDTLALCTYAKSQGIEVFTVALAVTNPAALTMLRSCATDPAHHFDATDSAALETSFASIARDLRVIRIAR
jgi:Flp pilus assembly protein TadG